MVFLVIPLNPVVMVTVTVSHQYAMENVLITGWWLSPTPL